MDKKKIHLVGIGGSGMSAVALVARAEGYEVSGCDLEKVSAYGEDFTVGHDRRHVDAADIVVVSPAVFFAKDNEEVAEAKKQNKFATWQEFVGKTLSSGKKVIAVSGTHGKSTTTAMAGKLLEDAGFDPTVIVGAKVPEWEGNGRPGKGKYFVIEADEFNDNFLHYAPEIIIINNIEFDHPDYFKDEEAVFASFKQFISKLTGPKVLIINKDSQGNRKLLESINQKGLKIITFSPSTEKIPFSLSVPGRHNIENAMGVVKLAEVLGINPAIVEKSLKSFHG
ncbi:MAG TPA: Mur ligase family protein, partial [Patescibacteria group bacterium]|nr:Mur ligase family protein [Patescibacteria group bacterium]